MLPKTCGVVVAKESHESLWNTSLLGGSCVVISGVISRVTILITHIRGHSPTNNYP